MRTKPQLTILGYNSAIPTINGIPSAQILEMGGKMMLIDCGEGTQVQLRKVGIKFSKISHIFISHLHGDHCFGLPGLIASYRLLGRVTPIEIYGPKGIEQMLETIFKLTGTTREFTINYHELQSSKSEIIYDDVLLKVETVPLDHRIYCNGYRFTEKKLPRSLNLEYLQSRADIPKELYHDILEGKDIVLLSGGLIPNHVAGMEGKKPKSYAYCSDTRFLPSIVPLVKGVDILYHESTFLHDLREMADYTGHSSAREAAIIAKDAEVGKLILGHFSNRYPDKSVFLDEAREIFPETYLPEALVPLEI